MEFISVDGLRSVIVLGAVVVIALVALAIVMSRRSRR
jgi:hypothetical protein